MHENNLLKVALMCSIVGIFVIFIFADRLEPSLISISDVSDSFIDQSVKIRGKIDSIKDGSSILILNVKDDTGSIKVVMFDGEGFELKKGEMVEVLGEVKEYRGGFEVEAKRVISV